LAARVAIQSKCQTNDERLRSGELRPIHDLSAIPLARAARDAGGQVDPVGVRAAVAGTLSGAPGVTVDYVEVLDPETLTPPDAATRGEAADGPGAAATLLVAVAAHVGPVRLIDNVEVGDREDEDRLLAATS
jgi:pantoate--beta-alanine ligase